MNLNKLRGLRAEKDLTQVEVAKMLDISENSYIQKEKGRIPFKDYEIARLCEIFKVEANIFF